MVLQAYRDNRLRMQEVGVMSKEMKFINLKSEVEITDSNIKNIGDVSAALEAFFFG